MSESLKAILKDLIKQLKQSTINDKQIIKIEEVINKIEKDVLIISVLGQFKRGKSTLINSLLQNNILPIGILPVTSIITKIQYGNNYAEINYLNQKQDIVELNEVYKYSTEQENPNNEKGISNIDLYLINEILKDGVILVDTPGVGSIHKHNTEATYLFMKESDAIIFTLSVDSPINEIEQEFLTMIKSFGNKIYFVINKIDLINQDELSLYIKYCYKIISKILDKESFEIIPISAKERIGTEILFNTLKLDIKNSKGIILNQSNSIKISEIINESISQINLYKSVMTMSVQELEDKKKELEEKLINLEIFTRDVNYHLVQKTNELIDKIGFLLTSESVNIRKKMLEITDHLYEKYKEHPSKTFNIELNNEYEGELEKNLTQLNQSGLTLLENGYINIANLLNQELYNLKIYIKEFMRLLFSIEFEFDHQEYTLSLKDDYYVSINDLKSTYFLNIRDLYFLLPKSYRNKLLYKQMKKNIEINIRSNINRMLNNYEYKIRESIRIFNYQIRNESNILKININELIKKVISDKENTQFNYEITNVKLEDIINQIKKLKEDINNNLYVEL